VGGVVKAAGGAAQTAAQSPTAGQVAQQNAGQLQQQAQGALGSLQQNAGQVEEQAAGVGKAGAWGAFLAAVFTLIASGLGGAAGVPERGRATAARALAPDTRPLEPQPHRP
jgi:hypothetical protein